MSAIAFSIDKQSSTCHARLGRVSTPHGSFDTPAFMTVGTKATIKGVLPEYVRRCGCQIVLANTYHLMLRPGSELVAGQGGLHRFMQWDGPILTDSGGYQVFSLSDVNTVTDNGVVFKSVIDGARIDLTPERSMAVQNELGADIIMAFDDCPPSVGDDAEGAARQDAAADRTARWLKRCVEAHGRGGDQALFGIVQGGTDEARRERCVEQVCSVDLPGYAIGGVAVGEGTEEIRRVVEHTVPLLPVDKPRYLMGVGYEWDLVMAVRAGVDMFDCVLPTRNGRNANAFTRDGTIRLRNSRYSEDGSVIEVGCDCPACGDGFSRSYIRHLFQADEMLGPILVSLHNIAHFQRLMVEIRSAIAQDDWLGLSSRWPVLDRGAKLSRFADGASAEGL